MNVKLTCVMLVLESLENLDIRKNDIKKIHILVSKEMLQLPSVIADTSDDLKKQIQHQICDVLQTKQFHLEQVYTLGDKKYFTSPTIDVIYLGICNKSYIKQIQPDFLLEEITINDNIIKIGDQKYTYQSKENIGPSIEYFFETNATDINCDKTLVEILTAWKYLRSRLDNTDSVFKFLPNEFNLEDVRQVYEMVSGKKVDKSNFHKRITKYCEEVPNKITRRGYRPSKTYKYKPKTGDFWL